MHSAGSLNFGFQARREFARLARFGANILDAHSCFIFLPRSAVATLERRADALSSGTHQGAPGLSQSGEDLLLVGCHSLSQRCISDCVLHPDSGLIGWVARHGHPIHVSPFEHDSRTLGTYSEDQQLKSFIAVPLAMPVAMRSGSLHDEQIVHGVIAADSKKAFAFSKLQGKLLEELADQAASLIVVALAAVDAERDRTSLEVFFEKAEHFCAVMGTESVEALRVIPTNLASLEQQFGIAHIDTTMRQLYRLLAQSMPPHTPVYISPAGELVCLIDNMMSSYFEGKAQALADHLSNGMRDRSVQFRFQRSGATRNKKDWRGREVSRGDGMSVMELIAATVDTSAAPGAASVALEEQESSSSVVPFSRFLRKVV